MRRAVLKHTGNNMNLESQIKQLERDIQHDDKMLASNYDKNIEDDFHGDVLSCISYHSLRTRCCPFSSSVRYNKSMKYKTLVMKQIDQHTYQYSMNAPLDNLSSILSFDE